MTRSLKQIGEERAALAKELRNLHENTADDQWSAEKQVEFDEKADRIARLDAQITRINDLDLIDASGREVPEHRPAGEELADKVASMDKGDRAHADAFLAYVRGGYQALSQHQIEQNHDRVSHVKATLEKGTDSKGGFLVPEEFGADLLVAMKKYGGVREHVRHLATRHGRNISWPVTDPTAEEGELLAEGAAAALADTDFGDVDIGAHMYSSKIIRVSHQLVRDNAYNIVGHINDLAGMRLGRITAKHYTTGDGVNKPQGLVTGAKVGKVGATTTGVTFDEILELEHAVDPSYRDMPNCKYMFHDQTLLALRKLKDGDGRPLWQPDIAGATRGLWNNYPYAINQQMSPLAAGEKSMLFGDLHQYMIRDATDSVMFLRFDDSAYMSKLQVGFLAFLATDGKYISAADDSGNTAVQAFQNAAS